MEIFGWVVFCGLDTIDDDMRERRRRGGDSSCVFLFLYSVVRLCAAFVFCRDLLVHPVVI